MVCDTSDTNSSSSRLSADHMYSILDRLKSKSNRDSTINTYHKIWTKFNNFVIKLDYKPNLWEDQVSLYCAHLVEASIQSSTLKSYISAIKAVLKIDGYQWTDNRVLFSAITKACKLKNDLVQTHLPIQIKLLEILLFEIEHYFGGGTSSCKSRTKTCGPQPNLELLYKVIFMTAYYGLMRIGELTTGAHPVKASDVHIGNNKKKILLVLRSSKTHGRDSRLQNIKISAVMHSAQASTRHFCPFSVIRQYFALRGDYKTKAEPFFIFRDRQPVQPRHVRELLRELLEALNLQPDLYNCHSFRIGRATDMFKFDPNSLHRIRQAGRRHSNAIFKYLRNL